MGTSVEHIATSITYVSVEVSDLLKAVKPPKIKTRTHTVNPSVLLWLAKTFSLLNLRAIRSTYNNLGMVAAVLGTEDCCGQCPGPLNLCANGC